MNHSLLVCREHPNPDPKTHSSQKITIIRTHVSLLRLLKFRQAQIPRAPIPVPVLYPTCHDIDTTAHRAQAHEADTYTVPASILRRVFFLEGVGGDDAADVAETDLPRGADGPAVVPTQVEVEPANNDGHGGVAAHRDEEQGCILEIGAVVDREEDGEAGDGDGDGNKSEQETVSCFIRDISKYHREAESHSPRWHRVELRADRGVTICGDDAWREEGIPAVSMLRSVTTSVIRPCR